MEQAIPYIIVAAVIGGVVYLIRRKKSKPAKASTGSKLPGGRGGNDGKGKQHLK